MAKPEFPDDQGFLCSEPDVVFSLEDAEKMSHMVDACNEASQITAQRLEEIGESLPDGDEKTLFQSQLAEWLTKKQRSTAAKWPWSTTSLPTKEKADDVVVIDEDDPPTISEAVETEEVLTLESMYPKPSKPNNRDMRPEAISTIAQDLTDYCNEACKRGCDDFVWLGWSAEQFSHGNYQRLDRPRTGTHLYFISTKGARKMLPMMETVPDQHMGNFFRDIILTKWRVPRGDFPSVKGCYIYPSVAHYYTHESCTAKKGTILEHHCNDVWAQPGTRCRPDHPEDLVRKFYFYKSRGPPEKVLDSNGDCELRLPEAHERCRWLTEAPPGTPAQSLGWRPRHEGTVDSKWEPPPQCKNPVLVFSFWVWLPSFGASSDS